jgi:hypothetical protein
MPSVRFEPAIPAINRLQTYALDRTATEIVGFITRAFEFFILRLFYNSSYREL